MKINTYAKINLNLKISKEVEDGLHNISSLMVPINLYDSIEIKETNTDVDKIQFDKEGISEENTISKSLNLLRSRSNLPGFFHIIIEKNIPIEAGLGGGSSNAFIMGGSYASPSQTLTEEWNGVSWTAHADNLYSYRYRGQQGDGSIYNFMHFGGTNSVYPRLDSVEFFDGVGWKIGPNLLVSVGGAFRAAAGRGFGGGMGEGGGLTVGGVNPPGTHCTNAQMFDQEATSTGSFGTLKGFGESTLKTNALFVSGSTFKLPLFSDKDINYHNLEPQESTGSISGSFERKPDKDIFTRAGNFFFHSDYNALGYTYQSASIYSQSIDFVTCYYSTASIATASTGFITQSHYCYTTVVCYITGSYT